MCLEEASLLVDEVSMPAEVVHHHKVTSDVMVNPKMSKLPSDRVKNYQATTIDRFEDADIRMDSQY